MRKFLKIFVLILFFSESVYCQDSNVYSISGKVRLLIGLEIETLQNVQISVNSNKIFLTDSLGNFKIDALKSGFYKLNVQRFGYKKVDTLIHLTASVDSFNLLLISKCDINKDVALLDIHNHRPKLLLSAGIAPIVYSNQNLFEKKYGIKYFDYGCISPSNECIEQYNKEIFKFLDKTFGRIWRKEVRKDVIGL